MKCFLPPWSRDAEESRTSTLAASLYECRLPGRASCSLVDYSTTPHSRAPRVHGAHRGSDLHLHHRSRSARQGMRSTDPQGAGRTTLGPVRSRVGTGGKPASLIWAGAGMTY